MVATMSCRIRAWLAAAAVALSWPAVEGAANGGVRPNIILIVADDLGYECLGAYGGTSYRTPHLDALARGGMRFTHCYSTPKCSPSRVTILTGRYTFRSTDKWGYIPPGEVTFGQVLREAGYATALAGKWQLGLLKEDPQLVARFGFQENCCWGWHEGPRYWQPLIWQNGAIRGDVRGRYGPDVYCDFLIDFIEEHRDGSFLAYYPMTLTHWPKSHEPKGPNGRWETYSEMVANMDRQVGRIVGALDRLRLREKTLILFSADNGSPRNVTSRLGERSIRGGKGTHTDAGTRVPLVASWPGTVKAGTTTDDLIDFSDFLPTLADLAGAKIPGDRAIDGRSFAWRLKSHPGKPREWVYTRWQGRSWVRDRAWKLYDDGALFDMLHDNDERRPVDSRRDTGESSAARKKLQAVLDGLERSAGTKVESR